MQQSRLQLEKKPMLSCLKILKLTTIQSDDILQMYSQAHKPLKQNYFKNLD